MATALLTANQIHALQGLYYGPTVVSATERGSYELMDLIRKGYAGGYYGPMGSLMWRIMPHGRDYLRDNGATPSLNDELGA